MVQFPLIELLRLTQANTSLSPLYHITRLAMVNLTKSIFKILSLHVIKFAYWNFTLELLVLFSYIALVWCLYLMRSKGKHYLFPLITNLTERNIISSLKCFANRPTETMKSFVLRCIEEVSTWTPFCISPLK